MDFSISEVQEALQQARNEIRTKGVVEDIDVIATVLATTRLLKQSPMAAQMPSQAAPMQFPETFAEWTANYSLASHNDQFLAAMMYLREKEQMNTTIVTDDIVRLYKKARWEMPKNPADVMGKAANRHYIAEAENEREEDGKKHWQMTKTGYDYFKGLHKENTNGS